MKIVRIDSVSLNINVTADIFAEIIHSSENGGIRNRTQLLKVIRISRVNVLLKTDELFLVENEDIEHQNIIVQLIMDLNIG